MTKNKYICTLILLSILSCYRANALPVTDSLPTSIKGKFIDDYGIQYSVKDSLWWQLPGARYHVLEINSAAQYIIAQNDPSNRSEPGLFTRIDYMWFNGMEPFTWGFCYTAYKAGSVQEARDAIPADRKNPKKGCNGFPFSRMRPEQNK